MSVHTLLNNLLMQLRKTGNHPLLLRTHIDDAKIRDIAKLLKANDRSYERHTISDIICTYSSRAMLTYLVELSATSDFYLHKLCRERQAYIPKLKNFLLSDDKLFDDAGKLNKLKTMLPELKEEGHRVLIFSQMTKMLDILGTLAFALSFLTLRRRVLRSSQI